jgi:hypothetical protein
LIRVFLGFISGGSYFAETVLAQTEASDYAFYSTDLALIYLASPIFTDIISGSLKNTFL